MYGFNYRTSHVHEKVELKNVQEEPQTTVFVNSSVDGSKNIKMTENPIYEKAS